MATKLQEFGLKQPVYQFVHAFDTLPQSSAAPLEAMAAPFEAILQEQFTDDLYLQHSEPNIWRWVEAAKPDIEALRIPQPKSIPIDWDYVQLANKRTYLPQEAWNIRCLSPNGRAIVFAGLKFYGRVMRHDLSNERADAWLAISKQSIRLLAAERYWYGQFHGQPVAWDYQTIANIQSLAALGEHELPNIY